MGEKFGGLMRLSLSGGRTLTIRGDFEERPSSVTGSTVTNQDGSHDKVIALRPYGFQARFRDEGIDLTGLLLETGINATLVEEHTGRTIEYTDGHFSGEPSVNRMNGDLTNLMFDARNRRQVV